MEKKNNYFELKKQVLKRFEEVGIDEISDFDWICCEITGKRRSELAFIKEFSPKEIEKINDAVEKRLKHIPLGIVFGKTNFYGYDFIVSKDVLIPRLDTEILVEKVIEEIKARKTEVSVLDIGTGSGAIAITIAKETGAEVTAVDISEKALEIAKQNASLNEVDVCFVKSDLFENIQDLKVDLIVSNPPYIESAEIDSLMPEVRDFEPILALDGGKTGLDFYEKIVNDASKHLNPKGKLFFEIGYNQGESVSSLMKQKFKNVEVIKDYLCNDRVVIGEMYDWKIKKD